jgi:site-specific DNA-adenine methylase
MSGYTGSKGAAGVAELIIGQMPPHRLYVEAFFGSGLVYWRKKRAEFSILIDRKASVLTRAEGQGSVRTICGDAIELLPELAPQFRPDTVVYCDPPYLLSTRQNRFYYDFELTDQMHSALLDVLNSLRCHVLLSGYPSDLYAAELKTWRCITYRTRCHLKTVTECLWCNFPEPAELHDWRYAGRNHRQRTSLKRLARRWLAKLEAMPERKRGYVLQAIREEHSL